MALEQEEDGIGSIKLVLSDVIFAKLLFPITAPVGSENVDWFIISGSEFWRRNILLNSESESGDFFDCNLFFNVE